MTLIFLALVYLAPLAFSAFNNETQLLFNNLPDDAIGRILEFSDNQIEQRLICSKWYSIINKTIDNHFGYQFHINYLKQLIHDLVNPININNHPLITNISVKIIQTLNNNTSIKMIFAKYFPTYFHSIFIHLLNAIKNGDIYQHRNDEISNILTSFALDNKFNSSNISKYRVHPYLRRFRFYNSMTDLSKSWNKFNLFVIKAIDDAAKTDDLKNISMDDIGKFLIPSEMQTINVLEKAGLIIKLNELIQQLVWDKNNYYSLKERQVILIENINVDKYITNMTKQQLMVTKKVVSFLFNHSHLFANPINICGISLIVCLINSVERFILDDPFGYISFYILMSIIFIYIALIVTIGALRTIDK